MNKNYFPCFCQPVTVIGTGIGGKAIAMTRIQQFEVECKDAVRKIIRSKMPEAKMLNVDFYHNLKTVGFRWDLTEHTCASGLQNEFITKLGFEVCRKKDATALMIIGEKTEGDCFIIGRCKNYWIKPAIV